MIIEKKKVLDNRVVFWMWLKMDFKDFSNFVSYSHFKKTCLSVIKQDEQILDNVVKYLCSSEQQDYLSKLNVLWDCFPAAQKRILDTETGKLNLRFNCLSSKIFFGQSTMRLYAVITINTLRTTSKKIKSKIKDFVPISFDPYPLYCYGIIISYNCR